MVAAVKGLDLKKMKASLLPIALAVSAVVWLLLGVPQIARLARLSTEAAAKRKLLADIDAGIQNFTHLEQEFASLTKINQALQTKLPPQEEFPTILELISGLARRNNIKIIALEPQKAVPHDSQMFVTIPVFIDAHCGYHDLGRFINELEFAPKFIKLQNVTINGADVDEKTHQVIMTVHTFCRQGAS